VFALSLLINGANSFVLFTHSVMYDAVDFVDNRNIKLPTFCSTSGCHVYVAEVSADFAANLKIVTRTIVMENNDLRTISSQYQKNGAKAPGILHPLPAGEDYFIENSNDSATSSLMTVFIVSMTAPNIGSSAILDGAQTVPVADSLPARILTIIDNQLSTIAIAPANIPNSVVMRTTGFDNADGKADNCNYVLDTKSSGKPFPGVKQQLINTQIITLMFDSVDNVAIERGTLLTWNFWLDDTPFTGFVTSAGHVGCSKAVDNDELYSIETLRSGNFYPDTFYYINSKEVPMNVHFDWDLNTPPTFPVTLTSNDQNTTFYGMNHSQRSSDTSNIQFIKILWERLNTGTFMARFTTEPLAKATG
ncbi:hypothetical protein PENTCL1PPCAC_15380, partial [Pristionchus entomophagus]